MTLIHRDNVYVVTTGYHFYWSTQNHEVTVSLSVNNSANLYAQEFNDALTEFLKGWINDTYDLEQDPEQAPVFTSSFSGSVSENISLEPETPEE